MQVILWICVALASALTLRLLIKVGAALYFIVKYIRLVGLKEFNIQNRLYGTDYVMNEIKRIYLDKDETKTFNE